MENIDKEIMKLLVISHKETWSDPASPSGYSTTGGFTFQMQALSELFDQTHLLLPLRASPPPACLRPICGQNISVQTLPEPAGTDWRRKLALLPWLPRYMPVFWKAVREADAVHAPVPGDLGVIGILVALALRKPLFVRHCGTWGKAATMADKFVLWLLERIAGGRNVVMATGWADQPPSARNPSIEWIFASTLTEADIRAMPAAHAWTPAQTLHLVTVGRLSEEKNIQAIIQALPGIRIHHPEVVLEIAGEGDYRPVLEKLVVDLGLQEQVVFHGNVSHEAVLAILSRSHLFVFPSLREGFPKAVLEAMACGLPVIASNVSVIPHLIADCGKVLGAPDADHVASAVLDVLRDPAGLQKMSEYARQTSQQYSLETWQAQIGERLQRAWGRELREYA
jgi:glycosyltransferase involved in cell wall biosynthesis